MRVAIVGAHLKMSLYDDDQQENVFSPLFFFSPVYPPYP